MPLASESTFKQSFRKKSASFGWKPITLTPPPVGMPDVMLLKRGKAIFIELKFNSNKISAIQHITLEDLANRKFPAFIVNKVDKITYEVYNYNTLQTKLYTDLSLFFNDIGIDVFLND